MSSPLAPPGFLSPAAFPFPNGPYGLPDDAPPVTPQPYCIGRGGTSGTNTATITIPAQNPAGPGDAIVVMTQFAGSHGSPASCTDTQGNAYSLAGLQTSLQQFQGTYISQNSKPLTAADTITVTFTASSTGTLSAITIGVPAGAVTASPGGAWLTYTSSASGTSGAAAVKVTAPFTTQGPTLIVAASAFNNALPPQFPQNWNVLATSIVGSSFVVATLPAGKITSGSTVVQVLGKGGGNLNVQYVTLQLETRIAPNKPVPDMPPGMQSPGAWQFAPAIPAGPAGIHYNPGPNRWTETLPAVPAGHAAVTRGTGKRIAAVPHPAGVLLKSAGKALAATAHPAATLTRATGKLIGAAAHPAGVLLKAAARVRTLAATARSAAALGAGKVLNRTFAAAAHAAASLSAGKVLNRTLAATVHAAATLRRGLARFFSARVTAAARLLTSVPVPVFKLGLPGTEWSVSISTIGISQLATQYVLIPVTATKAGTPYNPTTRTVQFAFMPSVTQVPGSGDWVAGSWETDTSNLLYPYSAQCLVGPSGSINPGIGTYVIYIRISDNPEIPVLIAGQLQIQ